MKAYFSCVVALALGFATTACSGDGDSSFDDIVGNGLGTFGEPAEHPCEAQARLACPTPDVSNDCYINELSTCATSFYLRGYAAETLPACDPSRPLVSIGQELDLRVFRGRAIRDRSVVSHAQGLQRYYEPHELWMTTEGVSTVVSMEYALTGSNSKFLVALNEASLDPSAPEDEVAATELIGQIMFAPAREFLSAHAVPIWAGVNVVVIQKILSPELEEILGFEGTVVGLGLSAALLDKTEAESEADDDLNLNTLLDIEGDFTPSLFVGHKDIAELTGTFDLVVAHELGHALGLAHVEDDGNLMQQGGAQDCRRWLSDTQVEEMGPFAEVVLEPEDALSRLRGLPRQVLRQLSGSAASTQAAY